MRPKIRKPSAPYRNWQTAALSVLLVGFLIYSLSFTYAFFDSSKQMFLGWGCFAVIFLMARIERFRQPPWRLVLILLAAFLALRYVQWRAFDTLLYTGPLDFVGMALLFLAEIYGFIIYLLGMFVNVWPLESKHLPLPEQTELWPTVDVYIPTYNEPDEIIRITATEAAQIDYPSAKLRVYLLDDGGTQAKRNDPEHGMAAWERHYRLRRMAAELGIGYITRETNQHAKAGNINHALHHTGGDLVLMLDCDHVPTRDILQNTVGHFIADPKLFLVQTPHFFINPSPVEKSLSGFANPSTESDMFYRRIHPAMNFWNASYFCGSAALLRVKYLLEVGGVSGTTITEDAETAFHLHSRGYNSIYVDKPMVCGLSPESYDDYVTQHSRWAQGMVQMLLLNNPLRMKGLSIPQRLTYFNSCFFWLFGFPRFIYFIAPASYLILGLNVYHASWIQIVAFTAPYVLSIYVLMDYFYAGTRQPFFSEIYETVQSLFLMPAVISVLLNPWKPAFKVTPKGLTNDKEYLSPVAAPFFLVIVINLAALILAIMKWFSEPILRDVILVTGVWCVYNLCMVLVSLGAFWERKQVRKFYRINAGGEVTVFFPRLGISLDGNVRDVSVTGIGFEITPSFMPREEEQIMLEVRSSYGQTFRFESRIKRAIGRNGIYFCGSEFVNERVSYAEVVAYVFGDSQRWKEVWAQKSAARGASRMLWYFAKMGIRAFRDSAYAFLVDALRYLWNTGVKWTTTAILRDTLLIFGSWCVYYFYLALAALIEMLNRKQVRKLQRISIDGHGASIYFPRLNATLLGEISDISLTGIGVIAELPFKLEEQERVTIKTAGKGGNEYQFDCQIQRAIKRGTKFLCGTEFIMDVFTYPKVVKFVYGDSLHKVFTPSKMGGDLAAQGQAAAVRVGLRMVDAIMPVLSFLFLNPAFARQDKSSGQDRLYRGNTAFTLVLAQATRIAVPFLSQLLLNPAFLRRSSREKKA